MMRTFPLRRDLGRQLLALFSLFVGLVLLAGLVFEALAHRRLEADIEAADLALARAVAQETNARLAAALAAVQELGQYPAVQQADTVAMQPLFETVLSVRHDVNLVYRLDARGVMLFHAPVGPDSTVGVDFSFRDYYQRALITHVPLISKGRISPTTGQPVATAVMPLWDDQGHFTGLVGTNLKLEALSAGLATTTGQFRPGEGPEIMVVDAAGQIIAHPNPTQLLTDISASLPAAAQGLAAGQAGALIAAGLDGAQSLVSYVPITEAGWGVVITRPTAAAFASLTAFQRGVWLALGIFLVGGALFWLILSWRVIRPLEWLADFSQSVGLEGEPATTHDALPSLLARPDQMGFLGRSLARMQQAFEARYNELTTLLDTSSVVVSTLDSQGVLARILEQVERLLQTPMCAIVALDAPAGVFRIRAARGLSDWYVQGMTVDPNDPSSVTMRALHSRQPIQISDTETNPSFGAHRERARRAGYRSILAMPLNTQHTPPSALLVFRPDVHLFSPREIALLTSFANHAAMALENAALYEHSDMRLQEQTHRLESLIQSMQDGLILEDWQGRVLYINRRMQAWCALGEGEVVDSAESLMDHLLAQAQEPDAARRAIEAALGAAANRQVEFAVRDAADRLRYLRLRLFDVTDARGTPIGRGRLLQDITQRQELDRMRSSLIATVSHELRTPLAAIKGYASTLLADDVQWDAQSQRDFLGIISREADHLTDLVSDLLDMSRIEAGNLTVSRTVCELADLIATAAALLPAGDALADRLQVDIAPAVPALSVDARRIRVVLRNLLENAVKYSPAQSPIMVRATREADRVVVRVQDQGPGIPAAHRSHVFNSFYRAEDGLVRRTPGAGLGLAIARGFVLAHGGQIWLDDAPAGLCVAFALPIMPPELSPAESVAAGQGVGG